MADHLLTLTELTVSLGLGRRRKEILHGISIGIDAGEIVGIIGETGSGKTTLARAAVGMYRPDAGRIEFDGADIGTLVKGELRQFRRRGELQYIFQDPLLSLDPDRSILASVGEPLAAAGNPDRAAVERALGLTLLDLDLAARRPQDLSGGQRQRALIARGLVTRPRIIFADEPVSALDAASRIQILELLRSLAVDENIGVAFISHDVGSVAGIADRIAVLYRGVIVETGTSRQIIQSPQHPYTRLLIGSTPSLSGRRMASAERIELRRALSA